MGDARKGLDEVPCRLVAPHCGQPLLPDTLLSPWSLSCSVSPQGSKTKRHPFPHHLGVLNTKAPSQTHGPFLCTGRGWGVAGPAALARQPPRTQLPARTSRLAQFLGEIRMSISGGN